MGADLKRSASDYLRLGQDALARGSWAEAVDCFHAALELRESAEALEGLSWAGWWTGDAALTFDARERAFRLHRQQGDRVGAARMAMWIGADYMDFRGETAIGHGWRQRARRLLEAIDSTAEHGWLAIHEGECALLIDGDARAARQFAEEATQVGRQLGVIDVEMMGLALKGLALVSEGRVEDGMSCLDEAAAAGLGGEFQQASTLVWVNCYLIYACERVRDFERAAQWCERMKEFARRLQTRFVLGVCRAHYGGVLMWRGTWGEAEAELSEATEDLMATRPPMAVEGVVRLAELRRRQGNLDEAERLFDEAEPHPLALVGRANLALDQDRPGEAVGLLERYLRQVAPEDRTARADALELLVRAHAAMGQHEEAGEALRELQASTAVVPTPPLRASASYSAGVLAVARRDYQGGRRYFEDAVDVFERCSAPFEAALARIELAGVLAATGQGEIAAKELGTALRALEQVGAGREAERASRLLAQVERRRPAGREIEGQAPLTPRELEVLRLVAEGLSDKEVAAALTLSQHTVHRHVANILAKLGCASRAAAVALAGRQGLL